MSKVNPEPNVIHIMGCYVLGNPNGEKVFKHNAKHRFIHSKKNGKKKKHNLQVSLNRTAKTYKHNLLKGGKV